MERLNPSAAIERAGTTRAERQPRKPVPPHANAIIVLFAGAWPSRKLSDATAQVWVDTLADLDDVSAIATARLMVKQSQFWPTIAEFLDVYRRHVARRIEASRTAERLGLTEGDTIDRNLAGIDLSRRILDRSEPFDRERLP